MFASLLEDGRRAIMDGLWKEDGTKMRYPTCFLKDPEREGEEKIQDPLKFAVQVSGFMAPRRLYEGFYSQDVKTPVLTVMGSLDSVVGEERVMEVVRRCEGGEGRIITHPGGHFVPASRQILDPIGGFVGRCVSVQGVGNEKGKPEEDSVEDMDVPF